MHTGTLLSYDAASSSARLSPGALLFIFITRLTGRTLIQLLAFPCQNSAQRGARTHDPGINSPMIYRLS